MGNTRTPNRAIELLALALEWQRSSIIERLRLRRELEAIRFDEYRNREKAKRKNINDKGKKNETENPRNSR